MPALKCTMLFTQASNVTNPDSPNHRVGGWSESWYTPATFSNAVQTDFETLCRARASILPIGAAVIGQRYQLVDPSGVGQTAARVFNGSFGAAADVPQMALLCKCKSVGRSNVKGLILRGIPDGQVVEGELSPSPNFVAGIVAYFRALGSWYFRGRDLSLPATPINTITANTPVAGIATVQCEAAHGLAANDMVRILKTHTDDDDFFGGRFQVKAIVDGFSFTILNWSIGNTTKGKVRKDAIVYPQVQPTIGDPFSSGLLLAGSTVSRIITRRVGRPFNAYRGRRSTRS